MIKKKERSEMNYSEVVTYLLAIPGTNKAQDVNWPVDRYLFWIDGLMLRKPGGGTDNYNPSPSERDADWQGTWRLVK